MSLVSEVSEVSEVSSFARKTSCARKADVRAASTARGPSAARRSPFAAAAGGGGGVGVFLLLSALGLAPKTASRRSAPARLADAAVSPPPRRIPPTPSSAPCAPGAEQAGGVSPAFCRRRFRFRFRQISARPPKRRARACWRRRRRDPSTNARNGSSAGGSRRRTRPGRDGLSAAPDRHQRARADVLVLGHHEAAVSSAGDATRAGRTRRTRRPPRTADPRRTSRRSAGPGTTRARSARARRAANDGGLPVARARFGARWTSRTAASSPSRISGEHAPHERAVLGDRDAVHAGELRGVTANTSMAPARVSSRYSSATIDVAANSRGKFYRAAPPTAVIGSASLDCNASRYPDATNPEEASGPSERVSVSPAHARRPRARRPCLTARLGAGLIRRLTDKINVAVLETGYMNSTRRSGRHFGSDATVMSPVWTPVASINAPRVIMHASPRVASAIRSHRARFLGGHRGDRTRASTTTRAGAKGGGGKKSNDGANPFASSDLMKLRGTLPSKPELAADRGGAGSGNDMVRMSEADVVAAFSSKGGSMKASAARRGDPPTAALRRSRARSVPERALEGSRPRART